MSLAEAFERAGLRPRDAALKLAIAKYQNNGGSYDEARALLDGAYGMPGKGQTSRTDEAKKFSPSVRQQNGGDEDGKAAPKGPCAIAKSSPPQGDGAGQLSGADDRGHPSAAGPSPTEAGRTLRAVQLSREPSAEDRKAALAARQGAAKAILRINGEDVSAMTLGRARTLLRESRVHNYVLSVLVARLNHLPDVTVIGESISAGEIASIANQGKEFANAS